MRTCRLVRPRGFSLRAVSDFYAGFVPGSGMAASAVDHLTLAFHLEGHGHGSPWRAVAVALREEGRSIVVHYEGTNDDDALLKQLGRMLGLGADADAWLALGERDEVVGALQREFPGFFTATKASPYDAATWAVIAPRMNMHQAARVKMAMARELGDSVELHGRVHAVFPPSERLVRLEAFPGLSDEKVVRLRGVGAAALGGRLEGDRLRAMAEDDALAELQTLRGIGPWAASHIYFRGAAPEDALPTAEPRILHGLADVLGVESVSPETFRRMAESWRPFRMWVSVLLSRHLARSGGWKAEGLANERARAGRELARRTRKTAPRVPA